MALHTRYLRRAAVKRPVLTRNSEPACMRVYPRYTGEVHTREGGEGRRRKRKFSWQSASVVTESDVHWSAARGAENHRHERRNLRSHHPCMQMPWPWGMPPSSPSPDLSLSSRTDYPLPPSARTGDFSSSYGPPARLQRARTFIGLPRILQPIVD